VGDFLYFVFISLVTAYFFLAFFKRDTAIILLPIFFPTHLFSLEFFGVPVSLIEALIWITALTIIIQSFYRIVNPLKWWNVLFTSFFKFIHPKRSFFIVYKKVIFPVVLFLLAALLSLIIVKDVVVDGAVFEGLKIAIGVLQSFIVTPLIMFFLILMFVDSNKKVISLLDSYALSAVAVGLWGVAQLLTGLYITSEARVSGPFESAGSLALYISPAVVYLLIRLLDVVFPVAEIEKYSFWRMPLRKDKFPIEKADTFLLMFSLLVLMPVLFATKSFGAMVAIFFGVVIYISLQFMEYRRHKKMKKWSWKFFAFVTFIGVFLASMVYVSDPVEFNSIVELDQENSSSVRVEIYTVSLNLIKDNWFTGIGMGQFPLYYQAVAQDVLERPPYEANVSHPHNLFLALWLNLGLIGLVAFIWIIVLSIRRVYPFMTSFAYNDFEHGTKLRVVGFCILMVILLQGIVDTPYFKSDLALLFWLIVGLIFATDNERRMDG
jgi:O-antigen ligase